LIDLGKLINQYIGTKLNSLPIREKGEIKCSVDHYFPLPLFYFIWKERTISPIILEWNSGECDWGLGNMGNGYWANCEYNVRPICIWMIMRLAIISLPTSPHFLA